MPPTRPFRSGRFFSRTSGLTSWAATISELPTNSRPHETSTLRFTFATPRTRRREIFTVGLAHDVGEERLELSTACLHEAHPKPVVEVHPRHGVYRRMTGRAVLRHDRQSPRPTAV